MKKRKEHIMKADNVQIVAFLSLEDFAADNSVDDSNLIRVQPITRLTAGKPEYRMLQWLVLVTALTAEGVAMTSILIGQRLEIFKEDDEVYDENVKTAAALIEEYLIAYWGYNVAPGIYSPQRVMDNIVGAGCDLWRFEEGRLVPVDKEADD
jgi:hypothetical protein